MTPRADPYHYRCCRYAVVVGGTVPSPQQSRLMLSGAALLVPDSLVWPYYQAALIPWVSLLPYLLPTSRLAAV